MPAAPEFVLHPCPCSTVHTRVSLASWRHVTSPLHLVSQLPLCHPPVVQRYDFVSTGLGALAVTGYFWMHGQVRAVADLSLAARITICLFALLHIIVRCSAAHHLRLPFFTSPLVCHASPCLIAYPDALPHSACSSDMFLTLCLSCLTCSLHWKPSRLRHQPQSLLKWQTSFSSAKSKSDYELGIDRQPGSCFYQLFVQINGTLILYKICFTSVQGTDDV